MFTKEGWSTRRCWINDGRLYVDGRELKVSKVEDETQHWKIFVTPVLLAAIAFTVFLGYQFIFDFESNLIGVPAIAHAAYIILIIGTIVFWWAPIKIYSSRGIYKVNDSFYLYLEKSDPISSEMDLRKLS